MEKDKLPEPRPIPMLVEIDYNVHGDWIDRECRDCGVLDGHHELSCAAVMRGWTEMLFGT